MSRFTAIRIKNSNGTYTSQIPVGVLAENVEYKDTTLENTLDNFDFRLDNVIVPDNSISAGKLTSDLRALVNSITAINSSPAVASTSSAMSDHDKIYVYTGGTTSSLTNGNWYYWNGSAWTSGGVYNAQAIDTDKTVSVENMAADAGRSGEYLGTLHDSLMFKQNPVNYGYESAKIESLAANPSGTAATHLGIKRYGAMVILNMADQNESLIRVCLSGPMQRTTVASSVNSFPGIQLDPNSVYQISLKILSGTVTGSDPTPGITIYQQGTSSTSLGESYRGKDDTYYRVFKPPATPVVITLHVYQGMTFTNAKFEIILHKMGQDDIPGAFQKLAYLQSNGTQNISTGLNGNQNTRIVCDFQLTQLGSGKTNYLFGARQSSSANIFTFQTSTSDRFAIGYNNTSKSTDIFADKKVHRVDYNKNEVYLDGQLIYTATAATFTTPYNLHLFAIRGGSSSYYYGPFRIYKCKIYDNGTLVRNFIPMINPSTGVCGMYDTVNGEIHNSAGSKALVTGEQISNENDREVIKHRESKIGIIETTINSVSSLKGYVEGEANQVSNKVREVQTPNTLTMLAVSDLHYKEGDHIIDYAIQDMAEGIKMIKKQVHIDYMTCMGDMLWRLAADRDYQTGKREITQATKLIGEVFQGYPQIRLVGNHDVNFDPPNFFTNAQKYTYFGIHNCWIPNPGSQIGNYGYIDDEKRKVRFICLNTTETASNYGITAAQLRWWASTLNLSSKTDANQWKIIMMSHVSMNSTKTPTEQAPFRQHMEIVRAYMNGENMSYVANLNNGATATISYDFRNKNQAELILWIHGHSHNFKVDNMTIEGDTSITLPRITIPNALPDRDEADWGGMIYSKTTQTSDSTAFVVNTINFDSKIFYSHCYGAGYDRIIHYEPQIVTSSLTLTTQLSNPTWFSLDVNKATVSAAGVVSKVAASSVMVYAQDDDGNREYWNIKVQ